VGYDVQYAKVAALLEPTLVRFVDRLEPGVSVLDVGAGQGRNARFLARRNFTVHALEPSAVAARTVEQAAVNERLAIEVFSTAFERFDPPIRAYAGILLFGLMPDLGWTAIRKLLTGIGDWGEEGTVVWVTGFTTMDPAYPQHKAGWAPLGTHSFQSPDGRVRTYLESGKILELFSRYTVLHHWEGLGPEHRHGDGPVERHGKFEAVLTREFA